MATHNRFVIFAQVIFFHYHTGDDLVPNWYRWIQRKVRNLRRREQKNVEKAEKTKAVRFHDLDETTKTEKGSVSRKEPDNTKRPGALSPNNSGADAEKEVGSPTASLAHNVSKVDDEPKNVDVDRPHTAFDTRDEIPDSTPDGSPRLNEGQGFTTEHAPRRLPSALRNSLADPASAISGLTCDDHEDDSASSSEALFEHSSSLADGSNNEGSNGSSSRPMRLSEIARSGVDPKAEFASSYRTRKGIKTILGRDADDFKNAKEMENNSKWQKVSHTIDDFSRVVFPLAFSIYLMVVLSGLDL